MLMMKRATLGLAVFSALCAFAYAGPEQLPDKEMKQVAPLPPACPNWTGFYVGAFGGYNFSVVNTNLDLGGLWDTFPLGRDGVESHAPRDLNSNGGEAGGLIGYNYQWHNWVFGAEGDGGYLWARKSNQTGNFGAPGDPFDDYHVATSFKTRYLATFGPRIGYAFCKWLPYVTGGLAVGELDYSQEISDVSFFLGKFDLHQGANRTETNVGWMVGGGLEYALTNRWHLRGQYRYVDLGSVSFDSSGTGTFSTPAGYTGHHEASLREHDASFAIIFKF
jgi:outer membrane immunogenic protein